MAELTQARLREILNYNPDTGKFTWRVTLGSRAMAGRPVSQGLSNGYRTLRVDGKLYRAHRLAWFYVHGVWPAFGVDHRNANKTDNRIENLRPASQSQNMANDRKRANNTSGFKGVSWSTARKKWLAHIMVNYHSKYLGAFDAPKEAHEAYKAASKEHFGEFARSE